MKTILKQQFRPAFIKKKWRALGLTGKGFLLFFIILLTYQYLPVHFFKFPEPTVFAGDSLYNPYAEMNEKWLQGNFHTHAYAWGGITNGHQDGRTIIEKYKSLGYNVITISDYFKINEDMAEHAPVYIPAYEHGTDIKKTHRLVMGSEKVDYYDIIYSANGHFKQFLIDHVNRTQPDLVAINHPGLRKGHDTRYLKNLTGYQVLEVLNRHRLYTDHWDTVLSTGKPVWILSNDDLHDLRKDIPGFSWTMINAETTPGEVMSALAAGKAYGVTLKKEMEITEQKKHAADNENSLVSVSTQETSVTWKLEKPAESIRLIGQNGELKKEVENTDIVEYTFTDQDTYIRAEVDDAHTRMYFNPVVRANQQFIPQNIMRAQIDHPKTLAYRLAIILVDATMIWLIWGKWLHTILLRLLPLPLSRKLELPGKVLH